MTVSSPRIQAETAHVLFVDLVGYSLFSMEDQARLVQELREVVRNTPELIAADSDGRDVIRLDSGDGMALVFFRDPLAPVQCATEVDLALKSHPQIRLRMGIHSGPVSRMPDINGTDTVTGGGVNFAERVMSCGDAGHILLSRTSAEMVREFGSWSTSLHDLGEIEVKHGVRLHLYNLVTAEVGNAARPRSFPPIAPASQGQRLSSAPLDTEARSPGFSKKVVILYKRNSADEERLQKMLSDDLTAAGHTVFVDRNLSIGIQWATEIERQITAADVVIVLLSAASQQSEMLDYEVQVAHRVAQERGGLPRLLPVRLNFEGTLPDSIGAILDPLQYAFWRDSDDDEAFLRNIGAAIARPASDVLPAHRREAIGGAVPLDSEYYVVRQTDHEFRSAVARRDSIVLVKGGRQMGKTSLLARGLQQAREASARVVFTDFQALAADHFESTDTLYRTLAEIIADQLDLDVMPEETWNPNRSANMNFERYLRREVLGTIGGEPLVWGLDEIDRLFTCPFGSEVFGLFRSWHNRRSLDPVGPWNRLTLAIAYATEAHLFITDLNQSPFNVGTRVNLTDFDRGHVEELNRRCGSPLANSGAISRFRALIGGQPYLVRRGLDELAGRPMTIDDFEAQASSNEGLFGDHLRRMLLSLLQSESLTEAARTMLTGRPCPSADDFYRLRASGIVTGESTATAEFRCRIYSDYLRRHLV